MTQRKLPCRTRKVTFEGAVFTLGRPTTAQVLAYAEGMDQHKDPAQSKERIEIITKLVIDSLNDGDPSLNFTAEDVDNELDADTFRFLYREVLIYGGFNLKPEPSQDPLPAAS